MRRPRFEVLWAPAAEQDLREIILYIAESSPGNALEIFGAIKAKARELVFFPHEGKIVPELKALSVSTYRQYSVPPWRMIFRVSKPQVYVVAVMDSRRDLGDLLLDRILDQGGA